MAVPAESFPWSCKPPPRPPPFPIPRSFLQPPAADPGTYTSPPYTLRPSRRPSHAGHRGPEFPHRRRRTPLFTPPGVPFVLLPHEGETESDKGEAPGPGHGPRPRFPSPSPSPSPAFGLARRALQLFSRPGTPPLPHPPSTLPRPSPRLNRRAEPSTMRPGCASEPFGPKQAPIITANQFTAVALPPATGLPPSTPPPPPSFAPANHRTAGVADSRHAAAHPPKSAPGLGLPRVPFMAHSGPTDAAGPHPCHPRLFLAHCTAPLS